MSMSKKILLTLILFSVLICLAQAQPEIYQLKLLAVEDNGEEMYGSDADLLLELKSGSGRVFLETFPLTKMDTQISTRFAKDIACSHFKLNCDKYDFIYTIKSKSNIIGGPSAGAAIAALTAIAVLDLEYDPAVAVTGTINSGGIIGPVGGVKEKLEAASNIKLKKVLIPKGISLQQKFDEKEGNFTGIDLVEYGKNNLSLEVIESLSLDEVVFHLTGANLNPKNLTLIENEEYSTIMDSLRRKICQRTDTMLEQMEQENLILKPETSASVQQLLGRSINSTAEGNFYSAASFCFSANLELKRAYYDLNSPRQGIIFNLQNSLAKKIDLLRKNLAEEKIETISDLQTLMIVSERIRDAQEQIETLQEKKNLAKAEAATESYRLLAYAKERYFSAVTWKEFFNMSGQKYLLNEEQLKNSCLQKISESQERYQYASFFVSSDYTGNIVTKIDTAQKSMQENDFILCLMQASQAKADSSALLSSIGVSEEAFAELLQEKIQAAGRVIAENIAEDTFPILGYSYYQYAKTLQESDPYTALVYTEYALEMGELGIYFPQEKTQPLFEIDEDWILAGKGFLLGFFVALLIVQFRRKRKKYGFI